MSDCKVCFFKAERTKRFCMFHSFVNSSGDCPNGVEECLVAEFALFTFNLYMARCDTLRAYTIRLRIICIVILYTVQAEVIH